MSKSRETSYLTGAGAIAGVGLVALGLYAWEAVPHSPSCNSLAVANIGGLAITADISYTFPAEKPVNGIIYSFGNGAQKKVVVNPADLTQSDSVTYYYRDPGNYKVTATLQTGNGQQSEQIAPTSDCQRQITIS